MLMQIILKYIKIQAKNLHLLHWYISIKKLKDVKFETVNPLYFLFSKMNGYFEDINKNKYLTLIPINEGKEIIKNMKNYGVKSEI